MKLPTFVICIDNRGYEASLEVRKLYEVVPDLDAGAHGQIRVIDESGEDYLHPATAFDAITLPEKVMQHIVFPRAA